MYTNFLTVLFLFYFVVFLYSHIFETIYSESKFTLMYLVLFFVLLARALINYNVGWKEIYSKDIQAFE